MDSALLWKAGLPQFNVFDCPRTFRHFLVLFPVHPNAGTVASMVMPTPLPPCLMHAQIINHVFHASQKDY